jgi:aryl-alcohol dehydrogenase-like predicted oxidoreductase
VLYYLFLKTAHPGVATPLRFTLSVPGVHTAIVGTTKPERWQENAALLARGALSKTEFDAIRKRWAQVAEPSWEGQV